MVRALRNATVRASIAVSDTTVADGFYADQLGLDPGDDQSDDSRIYLCADGTSVHVYASPGHAGTSSATVATFMVSDLARVVDELISTGVTFEQYDGSVKTNDKGIFASDDVTVAWCKDPDGNILAFEQQPNASVRETQS